MLVLMYFLVPVCVDELHALAIGRKIMGNLHHAGVTRKAPENLMQRDSDAQEPLYSAKELYGVVPCDPRQTYDARDVIARIVDGSEFDEFKRLYGTVSIP